MQQQRDIRRGERAHRRSLPKRRNAARGFTLLELLTVVAILAAVGAIAGPVFVNSLSAAEKDIAIGEMRVVSNSILQFLQDTGYFPRTGLFARVTDGGLVPDANLPNSPANLSQLYASPTDGGGAEIMPWNPDTGRGWRGPYVTSFGEGTVTIGEGFSTDGDAATTPLQGAAREVTAVADPFERVPVGNYMQWQEPISNREVTARGRPYLLFVDPDSGDAGNVLGCVVPCLLSMGENGEYQAGDGDDILLNF